jgi:hypothetical protein
MITTSDVYIYIYVYLWASPIHPTLDPLLRWRGVHTIPYQVAIASTSSAWCRDYCLSRASRQHKPFFNWHVPFGTGELADWKMVGVRF